MTDTALWGERRTARVGELFDLMANAPDGLTIYEIADGLGVEKQIADGAVRDFRMSFADDEINLTADPNGWQQPWLYKLVGTFEDARPWLNNRLGDMESRLETVGAVAASIESATKTRKNSAEHRRARRMHRSLTYLVSELQDIQEQGDV